MTLYDRLLNEAVRAYGYPAELRKGVLGVAASGGFGGLWLSCGHSRGAVRRGFRDLLAMLRDEPDLAPWRPWCRWLKESASRCPRR